MQQGKENQSLNKKTKKNNNYAISRLVGAAMQSRENFSTFSFTCCSKTTSKLKVINKKALL